MKYAAFYSTLFALIILCTDATVQLKPSDHLKGKRDADGRIEPVTTAVVGALAPLAVNMFLGVLGSLFSKPNDVEERVIYGRPMQVKLCGTTDNCIQVLDKGSGLTVVGKGDTVQHALGDAVGAMLTTLMEKRLLSLHDLCREHIHFPHPDTQNCPGVEVNTCDLSKPVIPEPKCFDSHGESYCQKMKVHCKESLFEKFMTDNCYKTCSNNCYKAPPGPCDY